MVCNPIVKSHFKFIFEFCFRIISNKKHVLTSAASSKRKILYQKIWGFPISGIVERYSTKFFGLGECFFYQESNWLMANPQMVLAMIEAIRKGNREVLVPGCLNGNDVCWNTSIQNMLSRFKFSDFWTISDQTVYPYQELYLWYGEIFVMKLIRQTKSQMIKKVCIDHFPEIYEQPVKTIEGKGVDSTQSMKMKKKWGLINLCVLIWSCTSFYQLSDEKTANKPNGKSDSNTLSMDFSYCVGCFACHRIFWFQICTFLLLEICETFEKYGELIEAAKPSVLSVCSTKTVWINVFCSFEETKPWLAVIY